MKFDQNAIDRVVRAGVEDMRNRLQRAFDDVHENNRGEPVDVVRQALNARLRQVEGANELTEPDLTQYAEAISEGRRVVLQLAP